MAVVQFRERGRRQLAKTLAIVHWVCILPSFICLLSALNIQIAIEDKIFFIEDYNGAILPGVLVFSGFFGLFTHILSGKVTYSVRRPDKRKKWAMFLLPVVIVTVVIFLSEMTAGIMCFIHAADLEKSFDAGIKIAMAAYRNDVMTKEQMDVLQMTFDCCGSKGYRDWFYVNWIDIEYINPLKLTETLLNERRAEFGSSYNYDDVPFSCCNPEVLRPCIYHHVIDNSQHYHYDHRTKTTLHTTGCADRLAAYYGNSVLMVIGTIVLSMSFIQLFTAVGCRYLQTAVQTAMDSDDPEGPSMGYLFVPGKKHLKKGLEDTVTSADTTALDTTALDTTASMDGSFDDSFDNRYMEEPIYANIPAQQENDGYEVPITLPLNETVEEDEHTYQEGEVEEYLASKFAASREKFELPPTPPSASEGVPSDVEFPEPPQELLEVEDEVPEYESRKSGRRLSFMQDLGSKTSQSHLARPSAAEVRSNHGSLLNISNSSANVRLQGRRSWIKHHWSPSPNSMNDSGPYVINMKAYKSPTSPASPVRFLRRTSPHRKHTNTGAMPYVINVHRHESMPSLPLCWRKRSPVKRSPRKQANNGVTRSASQSLRKKPRQSAFVPYLYNVLAKPRRRESPVRSPEKGCLAETTEFKSGVSYGCNHALE